jgi:hypothetical protein
MIGPFHAPSARERGCDLSVSLTARGARRMVTQSFAVRVQANRAEESIA